MITKVRVRNFKRFGEQEFELSDHVVLAGPNNSGKSTLLQAISAWQLALKRWTEEREKGSKAKTRTGVAVTRKDFTAIPLREMKLLWTDTSVSLRKHEGKPGYPREMEITLEGVDGERPWELTFEFRHQNSELIYVKPSEKHDPIPDQAREVTVVHVPAFSGIGAEETRYDKPYQDLLIGQGKAGDILRNLLLEVYHLSEKEPWESLCSLIQNIFGYTLLPPQYEGRPFILCEYLQGTPPKRGKGGLAQLDIASAGSGFHQVLLLLAFFHARPSAVLLLDEPDAHLHVILQKQIYDLLRRVAGERHSQLIIATHAEVLIDNTDPTMVLSFFGTPRRLVSDVHRDEVREALKRLTATDILLAQTSSGVLYVEGQTDFDLLQAWAGALDHPAKKWFSKNPFWHNNRGRNPQEAKAHFFALRAIEREIRGVLLLDGDNRGLPDHEVDADGLQVERWERYEAESYLVYPEALRRFVESRIGELFAHKADDYLKDHLPPSVYRDPVLPDDYFTGTPASKTLLPGFFKAANLEINKQEYYQIAEQMRPEEIPEEVSLKLDAIVRTFEGT